jgi:hypothetical protein
MMPTILRRSGPDSIDKHGKRKTPRAMIHYCETCGYEGAAFGVHAGGVLLSYCGWVSGEPVCVGKAKAEAA